MAVIDNEIINLEASMKNAYTIKNLVIKKLVEDGLLNNEQAEKYIDDVQVIIFKKSWFQRWWDKYAKGEEDGYMYSVVGIRK